MKLLMIGTLWIGLYLSKLALAQGGTYKSPQNCNKALVSQSSVAKGFKTLDRRSFLKKTLLRVSAGGLGLLITSKAKGQTFFDSFEESPGFPQKDKDPLIKIDPEVADMARAFMAAIEAQQWQRLGAWLSDPGFSLDVNAVYEGGYTFLTRASSTGLPGYDQVVRELLRYPHTDPNAVDFYGNTGLIYAVNRGDWPVIHALLESPKTDVDQVDRRFGLPPLKYAHPELVEELQYLFEEHRNKNGSY